MRRIKSNGPRPKCKCGTHHWRKHRFSRTDNAIDQLDPNRPGLPAKLNATAGKVSAQHDFHIGGLAAVNTSLDALDRAPLRHTTQGLQATAAQLPAGRWQYDWLLIPTKKSRERFTSGYI